MTYTDKIHLVADTLEELHAFAEKIGLNRCYFEGVRKGHPHYDIVVPVNKSNKFVHKPVYINGVPVIDICLSLGTQLIGTRQLDKISQALIKKKTPIQQSLEFIAISNEMFKGSKPMDGKEYSALQETLKKTMKSKPTRL